MKRWPLAISTRSVPSTLVGSHLESRFDLRAQLGRVRRFENHDVAADLRFELRRAAFGHHAPFVQQNQPIALVRFIEDVACQQHRHAFRVP